MRKRVLMAVAIGAVLVFAASGAFAQCSDSLFSKRNIGGVLGGAGGALGGSQFGSGKGQLVTTAAGTIIGMLVGSEAGHSMDCADTMYQRQYRQPQPQYQPPVYQQPGYQPQYQPQQSGPVVWANPQPGYQPQYQQPQWQPTAPPVPTGREGVNRQTGQTCREFTQQGMIGGQSQTMYGTACLGADGQWRIIG